MKNPSILYINTNTVLHESKRKLFITATDMETRTG